jgi:seryl-tRNA synthetase
MLLELLKQIRENEEEYKRGAELKNVKVDIDKILDLDEKRKNILEKVELLRAEQNKISKKFDKEILEKAKKLKEELKEEEKKLNLIEEELDTLLHLVPNPPLKDVPIGKDENDNVVLRKIGEKTKFDFEPKSYLEIAEKLDWIDVKKAAEVSGTRFGYLKKQAALLEFALVKYCFDVLTNEDILKEIANRVEKGYSFKPFIPVVPPVMIKPDVFKRMARLSEEDKEDRYYIPKDDLYLIGSTEHTLGPLHMDEILKENDLPIRYIGFSTAFRREAGSYGKDTKGILRVHQFDQLEMETFSLPENSLKEQEFLVGIQEYLMSSLKIPYQVVSVCTGDMAKVDAKQIDIECWIPSENKYRETHSADLTTIHQSNRLNTRARRNNKEIEFVHINDATGFAIGRTIIAIIENYQQKDGSVRMPEVLKGYI